MTTQVTTLNGHTSVGVYTVPTEVVSAAAQTQLMALVDVLEALITGQTASSALASTSPNFDKMDPAFSKQLLAELAAISAAIDAAPTA